MTLRRLLAIIGPSTAGLALSAVYWSQVPARIPIHWDENGNADGWAPRAFGLLFAPVLGIVVAAITSWAVRKGKAEKAADALALGLGAFHLALHWMVIRAALDPQQMLAIGQLVVCMGALVVGLGLAMPHLSPNKWAGVRTPWTLADEVNWKLTHQFAAWTMGIGGAVAMLAGILLAPPASFWTGIGAIVVGSMLPIGYSYVIHRARRQRG